MFHKIKNIYLFYLLICLLTIPTVILIFKRIHPKNIAAIFAGGLFILISLTIVLSEFVRGREKKSNEKNKWTSLSFIGAFQFLSFFSIPMFLVRMINFTSDFENLEIFFIPATLFHKFSNFGFILMVLLISVEWIQKSFLKNLS